MKFFCSMCKALIDKLVKLDFISDYDRDRIDAIRYGWVHVDDLCDSDRTFDHAESPLCKQLCIKVSEGLISAVNDYLSILNEAMKTLQEVQLCSRGYFIKKKGYAKIPPISRIERFGKLGDSRRSSYCVYLRLTVLDSLYRVTNIGKVITRHLAVKESSNNSAENEPLASKKVFLSCSQPLEEPNLFDDSLLSFTVSDETIEMLSSKNSFWGLRTPSNKGGCFNFGKRIRCVCKHLVANPTCSWDKSEESGDEEESSEGVGFISLPALCSLRTGTCIALDFLSECVTQLALAIFSGSHLSTDREYGSDVMKYIEDTICLLESEAARIELLLCREKKPLGEVLSSKAVANEKIVSCPLEEVEEKCKRVLSLIGAAKQDFQDCGLYISDESERHSAGFQKSFEDIEKAIVDLQGEYNVAKCMRDSGTVTLSHSTIGLDKQEFDEFWNSSGELHQNHGFVVERAAVTKTDENTEECVGAQEFESVGMRLYSEDAVTDESDFAGTAGGCVKDLLFAKKMVQELKCVLNVSIGEPISKSLESLEETNEKADVVMSTKSTWNTCSNEDSEEDPIGKVDKESMTSKLNFLLSNSGPWT